MNDRTTEIEDLLAFRADHPSVGKKWLKKTVDKLRNCDRMLGVLSEPQQELLNILVKFGCVEVAYPFDGEVCWCMRPSRDGSLSIVRCYRIKRDYRLPDLTVAPRLGACCVSCANYKSR